MAITKNRSLGGDTVMKGDKRVYVYGMRLRGFAPGCQPMDGLVEWKDEELGYHSVLWYSRKLTEEELVEYELAYLGEGEQK